MTAVFDKDLQSCKLSLSNMLSNNGEVLFAPLADIMLLSFSKVPITFVILIDFFLFYFRLMQGINLRVKNSFSPN